MTESASSSKSAFAATDRPSVDGAYALRDLSEVVQRFHRSRDASWLSIARSIAAGLGVEAPIAADVRPEATARPFPAATVFLLGATSGGTPGCIGHVSARPATWTVGGAGLGVSDATIAGGSDLAQAVKTAVLESVRPVSPEAVSPDCEIIIPTPGEGDSQALAVAIAAMHALLGCGVPPGLAATGGFDPHHTKFRTVPIATLPAKLAAAGRWGLRTLVVVEGQPLPDDLPDGLRIIEASRDPEALPLLVLQLASDAGWEESAIAAWRRALALYDLRVASRRDEPIDSVVDVIRPFLDPVAGLLDPGAVPIPSAVQAATRTANCDPILVGLAADIRSRVLLHAGRSVESAWWDAMAVFADSVIFPMDFSGTISCCVSRRIARCWPLISEISTIPIPRIRTGCRIRMSCSMRRSMSGVDGGVRDTSPCWPSSRRTPDGGGGSISPDAISIGRGSMRRRGICSSGGLAGRNCSRITPSWRWAWRTRVFPVSGTTSSNTR